MKRTKITDDMLREAVKNSNSVMGVLRYLGIKEAGGSNTHYSKRIKALEIDTQHFVGKGWNAGKTFTAKQKKAEDILIKRESGLRAKASHLRRSLISIGRPYECSCCGQGPEWRGNPLTLDVDHINEDWLDDRESNLRFLCPNCHSQFSRNLLGS